MTPVVIRAATIGDAEAAADIYVRTASVSARGLLPDAYLDALVSEDYVESWRRRIGSPPPHAAFVAEDGQLAVGIAYVEPSPDADATAATGHLDMLYVLPDYAGRGIGTALNATAVMHLQQSGFHEATLWVLTGNAAARRFYERNGWERTKVTWRVEEEGFTVDLVRYRRDLTGRSTGIPRDIDE